jgi:hypothetical protein
LAVLDGRDVGGASLRPCESGPRASARGVAGARGGPAPGPPPRRRRLPPRASRRPTGRAPAARGRRRPRWPWRGLRPRTGLAAAPVASHAPRQSAGAPGRAVPPCPPPPLGGARGAQARGAALRPASAQAARRAGAAPPRSSCPTSLGMPASPWDQGRRRLDAASGEEPARLRPRAMLWRLSGSGRRSGAARRWPRDAVDWQRARLRLPRSKGMRLAMGPLAPRVGHARADDVRPGRPPRPRRPRCRPCRAPDRAVSAGALRRLVRRERAIVGWPATLLLDSGGLRSRVVREG